MFNQLVKLLVVQGAYRDVPSLWRPKPVWMSVTCSRQKIYMDRFGDLKLLTLDKLRLLTFAISNSATFNTWP